MLWTPTSIVPRVLREGAIHVYRTSLDEGSVDDFTGLLSSDERTKAGRFHFEKDRRRFVVRRGTLRLLLSQYLNMQPAHIRFAYTAHGKPYVPDANVQFNLSDAEHVALYAFARVPIGVDVEYIQAMADMDDVAALMFSKAENAVYRALPKSQQAAGFFNCWTRKEAFIKAVGEGLSYPLADFEVTLRPDEAAAVLRVHDDTQAAARWSLYDLRLAQDFCGALAVQGDGWQMSYFQLS
ncbi:MAG: 4'-phosphopantetheinyl transferase superfamily protein [Anaerolineae bacterium]